MRFKRLLEEATMYLMKLTRTILWMGVSSHLLSEPDTLEDLNLPSAPIGTALPQHCQWKSQCAGTHVMCSVPVVMVVGNATADTMVKEIILQEIPAAKIDVMELDLSTLASVEKISSGYESLSLPQPSHYLLDFMTEVSQFLSSCLCS